MDLMQLSSQMIILCRQASVWDNCRASTNEAFVVQEQEKCHTGMETSIDLYVVPQFSEQPVPDVWDGNIKTKASFERLFP